MFGPIMGAIKTAGSFIGNNLGSIGSILGYSQNQQQAGMNFKMQKRMFQYQKHLNNVMMSREDNAVQRRAADMEKAGISKTLAAGAPAQAGRMSSAQAPQHDASPIEKIQVGQALKQMRNDMQLQDKEKIQRDVDIDKQREELRLLKHEVDTFIKSGTTRYDTGNAGMVLRRVKGLRDMAEKVDKMDSPSKDWYNNRYKKIKPKKKIKY